jgi:hypothetical protein
LPSTAAAAALARNRMVHAGLRGVDVVAPRGGPRAASGGAWSGGAVVTRPTAKALH